MPQQLPVDAHVVVAPIPQQLARDHLSLPNSPQKKPSYSHNLQTTRKARKRKTRDCEDRMEMLAAKEDNEALKQDINEEPALEDNPFAKFAFSDTASAEPPRKKLKSDHSSSASMRKVSSNAVRHIPQIITGPFVNNITNGFRERWTSVCEAHFKDGEQCPCFPEAPLDLLFVGINPSDVSWKTGCSYGSKMNLFWRILYETGVIGLTKEERMDLNADFSKMPLMQNRMGYEYGFGFTDLGCREAGSDAGAYSEQLVASVWYPDFCRRARAHVDRVRARGYKNYKRRRKTLPESAGYPKTAHASLPISPTDDRDEAVAGKKKKTAYYWAAKDSNATQEYLKGFVPATECRLRNFVLPRKKAAYKEYTGPKMCCFTGKKQFLSLVKNTRSGDSGKFEFGLQKNCKIPNWPFPNTEIWVMPSTSGRAVFMTKEERYGPYRRMAERLVELRDGNL